MTINPAPIANIKFQYTGPANIPSYFDTNFLDTFFQNIFGANSYDAWCADRDISLDTQGGAATLQASVYSIYELGSDISAFPTLENPQNLDKVNWLLNQHFSTQGYTFGEVQAAIWELLGDSYVGSTSIGTVDSAKIQTLVDLANTNGSGFKPDITDNDDTNDFTLLLIAPFKANGTPQQPTLIQVKSAALGDYVWHDTDGDGIQDTNEVGIAGAIVRLARDHNNDGTITDDEVLQTTTTDSNGQYKFTGLTPGLNYQVQFFTPAGFDAASPRQQGANTSLDSDGALSDIVVLSAGEWNKSIDSGFYKQASLGNFIWFDGNQDGIQNNNEVGIGGVKLTLTGTTNGGQAVTLTTTTNSDGSYLFSGLAPGSYQVSVDASNFAADGALEGFVATGVNQGNDITLDSNDPTQAISLNSGDSNLTVDYGFYDPAVPPNDKAIIGDRVWEDKNANGIQDSGEDGISGVTIQLKDAGGNVIGTTTTDSSGNYSFEVTAGTYSIGITPPAGYVVSPLDQGSNDAADSDIDPATNMSANVTVAAGETNNTLDAGLYRLAQLGDRVWLDENGNGQQDGGEAGKSGVTVNLLNNAGVIVATQTTDSNGNYLFTDLIPGTYSVEFVAPSGFEFTVKDSGADASDSDADPATGKTGTYTLQSGDDNRTVDAGLKLIPQPAFIGDRVWEDKNANGIQDSGEDGISGVTIQLKDAGGNVIGTTTTDSSGNYSFEVTAGTYSIGITPPAGYVVSPLDQGSNDAADSDIDPATNMSANVTVAAGETNNTLDAGLYRLAQLGDRVWLDENGNGQQDGGEAGKSGVTVNLLNNAGVIVATQTTDSNGNYLFTDLIPGTYSVEFVAPSGFEFTVKDSGADASDSDADPATGKTGTYTLQSGDDNRTVDAGLKLIAQPAFIGDRVWEDKNANGIQDSGEDGISGVTIQLKDAGGNVIGTTTTDSSGNYSFEVTAGTYSIGITPPAGYVVSPLDQGSNDAADSDIDPATNMSANVTVAAGETNNTLDAGLYRLAQLGDRVWLDENGNGQQDGGEAGKSGVTVNLLNSAGAIVATQTTDSNGNYLFTDLIPGTYSVEFIAPSGFEFTVKDSGADASDSDADPATGKTGTYTLQSGDDNRTVDAGLKLIPQPAFIGDRVWEDKNANGIQDSGEDGISGVTIQLKDAGGNVIGTTTTDSSGNYSFEVTAGTYSIGITPPAGYVVSPLDQGSNDAADSDIDPATNMSANVTVAAGETNNTLDAGLYRLAQLGDRVWLDENGNGQQDGGEAGKSGVTVNLLNSAGAIVATQTTDSNGNYLFTDLIPGTYSVEFIAPSGFEFTVKDSGADASDSDADPATGKTGTYTLQSGDDNRTVDAGLKLIPQPAFIGDRVWEDKNANGIQDSGEDGISGVTIQLKDAGGNVIGTTTTDSSGNYSFEVAAGTYSIGITPPAGYVVSPLDQGSNDAADSDIDPATNMSANVTVAAGETNNTLDAGLYRLAQLGDRVWLDENGNGQQDGGEAGKSGVTVNLLNNAGAIVATQTTDSNGNYLFTDLVPGTYSVEFVAPSGFEFTVKDSGADASDSDADPATGKTGTYTLQSGDDNRTVDAGLKLIPQPAFIGDRVWEDKNANGIQDSGEDGISGVTIQLKDAGGNVIGTTTTDSSGNYSFEVTAGTYSIGITPPAGYVVSPLDQGSNDAADSDIDPATNMSANVTVAAGETNNTLDAGLYRLAQLGDRVWLDENGNGQQDGGEAGKSGVTVNLLNNAGAIVATQTTDSNGNYLFTDLIPGTYSVEFVAPSGFEFTVKDSGADASDSDADPATGKTGTYTLQSGDDNRTVDAGLKLIPQPAFIGDRVWEDKNANGIQDSGEDGISGVTIQLKDAGGNVIGTTTTDSSGNYSFEVAAGTYSIGITPPAGYVVSPLDQGSNDAADSDIDPATNMSANVTVAAGETNNTLDAGLYRLAQLGDRVWLDENGNGQQDGGEAGKSGVTVNLLNNAGAIVATQTTDSNGNYLFTDLIPGTYSVEFVAPSGFEFTVKDSGADASDSDADPATGKTGTYTLQSGDDNRTVDAGLKLIPQPAFIGDRVWEDKNANGIQDSGEDGISGVTIQLKDAGGNVIGTTTTDSSGNYSFEVTAGTYSIGITPPAGYVVSPLDQGSNDAADSDIDPATNMSANVTVAAGETNNTLDAGLYRLAQLGDRVWLDENGNGQQDGGEAGKSGVTVNLLNNAGAIVATQTTDSNGNYLFTDLVPGTYSVEFVAPSGFEFTVKDSGADASDSDADPATGKTGTYTLQSGDDNRTVDAGLKAVPHSVCLTYNFNGSSPTDGSDGNSRSYTVEGVTVTATAWSRDKANDAWSKAYLGAYNGGHGVTDNSEGDGSGNKHTVDNVGGRDNFVVYQFSENVVVDKAFLGYVSGDSDIQVWIGSSATPLTNMSNAVLSNLGFTEVNTTTSSSARWADINAGNLSGNVLVIAADTTDTSPEDYFKIQQLVVCTEGGHPPAEKASIGDRVWEDKNFNGIQDAGESGIKNVAVKLLNTAGNVIATTTTGNDGQYRFDGLDAGDYKVQVVAPSGYYYTRQDKGGNDALDSDVNSGGMTGVYTLAAGQENLTVDAGLYRKASIGDRVWEDSNHNGIQDKGEFNIKGIRVSLLDANGNIIANTTTNSSGNYLFSNLDPGTYSLRFDKADVSHYSYWNSWANMNNWKWGAKDVGSDDNKDSDVNNSGSYTRYAYTAKTFLESGENDMRWDAAITPIVIDLNGDGIKTIARADSQGAFDLFGNGKSVHSGWVSGEDGLLAIDRNGNGVIDDISELFGGTTQGEGFARLAEFDTSGDGWVDTNDADFARLLVWQDKNGDHQTDQGELISLNNAGIASLSTSFSELPFVDAQGNLHLERSEAILQNGQSVDMTDVYFNVSLEDATDAGVQTSSMLDLLGDTVQAEVVNTHLWMV